MVDIHNEILGKVFLALFVIELLFFLIVVFLGPQSSLPNLNTINGLTGTMQTQINNIVNALAFQPLKPIALDGSSLDALTNIANVFIEITDFIIGIFSMMLNFILLFITGLTTTGFILIVFLPSLISVLNIGVFGYIFGAGYALVIIMVALYTFNWLIPLISDLIKTLGSLIP